MGLEKSRLNRLGLPAILFGMLGAAASAQTQLQPLTAPAVEPTVHDAKVRPRDDLTDGKFSQTPDSGASTSTSDVKRIRTTRERITDGSAPPRGRATATAASEAVRRFSLRRSPAAAW
ncbi:hypothetical protein [Bradyrhizobium sp. Gha]|uniref:hypothetical protein n=1 Tax=Bradyrhizobium sp. Gha TaxID=1855318 RepID=UPI0008E6A9E1|nr:hypothetical protein [Bradyrhizobium sp. Gha]SFI89256.1 hypothetical protein SAMN05216525_11594 [Bradyrhizobium sp. Gha]